MNQLIHAVAIVAVASSAFAQGGVTNADLAKLDTSVAQIRQQAQALEKINPAGAASIQKALNDLSDEVSFLKVKMRREGPVTPAEYADVRDRLELLRVRAFGAGAPAATPAAPRPLIATTPKAAPPQVGDLMGWNSRFFANVGLGLSFSKQTVTTTLSMPLYDETATITAAREIKAGRFIDISGGLRLGSSVGVGVNFNTRSSKANASATASIPDPLAFDLPRVVSGAVAGMTHKETWISPLFVWMIPIGEKLDLMVMAGPSIVNVQHETLDSAKISESSDGPAVTLVLKTLSRTVIGFQVGADVQFMITKNIGAGGFFRFTRATANLSDTVKLKPGGPQVGFGARVRF